MNNATQKKSASTSKHAAADAKDNAEDMMDKPSKAYFSLRSSYLRAFIDYYFSDANHSGISGKSTDKFTLTRYIRDSAENLIQTLKGMGKDPEDPLCEDVEKVFSVSVRHAERLGGGRTRPFERRSSASPERRRYKRRKEHHRREEHHRRGLLDSYRPGDRDEDRDRLTPQPTDRPTD